MAECAQPPKPARRGYYTLGWLIAVLTLYVAHQLDGHWVGAVIVLVGYLTGGIYVARQEADVARHTRTDPACVLHRPPTTTIGRWWFDRRRGRRCRACCPPPPWMEDHHG